MKVAIILASDFIEGNGANARIKAFAKGFVEKNLSVDLLFLHASSFNDTRVNIKSTGYWHGIYYKFLNGSCVRPNGIAGKVFDSLKSIFGSVAYLLRNRKKYDLFFLYCPTIYQSFQIYLFAKIFNIPVVVERTELFSSFFERKKGLKNWLFKKIHLWDEKNSHKFTDHLFVISKKLHNHFSTFIDKQKISYLPIVVDFSRFSHLNGSPKNHQRVGYIGSFGEKDGIPGILRAFFKARSVNNNLKLRLMGFHKDPTIFSSETAKKLNGSVEVFGQVKYDEIPDLLYECDLLLVNRTDDSFSHYGFPTKLGEYLATGKPTVVTRVGDVENYFTHKENTLIVEPGDEGKLTEIILNRYEKFEEYSNIGKRGKETCLKFFNYTTHVENMIEVFEDILRKKKDRVADGT